MKYFSACIQLYTKLWTLGISILIYRFIPLQEKRTPPPLLLLLWAGTPCETWSSHACLCVMWPDLSAWNWSHLSKEASSSFPEFARNLFEVWSKQSINTGWSGIHTTHTRILQTQFMDSLNHPEMPRYAYARYKHEVDETNFDYNRACRKVRQLREAVLGKRGGDREEALVELQKAKARKQSIQKNRRCNKGMLQEIGKVTIDQLQLRIVQAWALQAYAIFSNFFFCIFYICRTMPIALIGSVQIYLHLKGSAVFGRILFLQSPDLGSLSMPTVPTAWTAFWKFVMRVIFQGGSRSATELVPFWKHDFFKKAPMHFTEVTCRAYAFYRSDVSRERDRGGQGQEEAARQAMAHRVWASNCFQSHYHQMITKISEGLLPRAHLVSNLQIGFLLWPSIFRRFCQATSQVFSFTLWCCCCCCYRMIAGHSIEGDWHDRFMWREITNFSQALRIWNRKWDQGKQIVQYSWIWSLMSQSTFLR